MQSNPADEEMLLSQPNDPKPFYIPRQLEVGMLTQRLVRHDASAFFAEHFEEIYHFWVSLLQMTALPGTTRTDSRIVNTFEALDNVIVNDTPLSSRLAYVQLSRFYTTVKQRISSARRKDRTSLYGLRRDATIAGDTHPSVSGHTLDREWLRKRLRRAKRWAHLAGSSPLLLVTYSEDAEWIMYVPDAQWHLRADLL